MEFPTSAIVLAMVCCTLLTAIIVLGIGQRPVDFPPGPPTLPLIGNIHQMPSVDAHLVFEKWAREYGDVYSLILGSQTLVVLNSDEVVKELFERRGGIYSSRPDAYIGQKICSGGLRVVLMKYGARWRTARRVIHSLLNHGAAQRYIPFQDLENRQMLNELLDTPQDLLKHIRRHSNALTTSMLYGWRTTTYDNPDLQQLFNEFEQFAQILQRPETALLDAFPVLQKLPNFLSPVTRKGQAMHKNEKALYMRHWLRAKRDYHDKIIPPCFSAGVVEVQEKEGFSDADAAYVVGNILEAGSDTTANELYAFVQAMLLYPEIQKRGQEAVDRVCKDRLPGIEDQADLPFIRCLMKETLRWMPTAVLGGIPHATTATDTYKDMVIPAGATVICNSWAINMDPRRASNPRKYDPDRYKDDHLSMFESLSTKDSSQRDHFTFGGGRRACPGIHVVDSTLFLGIARLLWAFDISPAKRPDGTDILPNPDRLTQGALCRPEDFESVILPRSSERAAAIRSAWSQMAEEVLHPVTKQWLPQKYPM